MKSAATTGATALVSRLRTDGHAVTVLTRHPRNAQDVQWNPYGSPASWVHVLEARAL